MDINRLFYFFILCNMLAFVFRFFLSFIANGFVLYYIAKYVPNLGFSITPLDLNNLYGIMLLGAAFFIVYYILGKILDLLTLPLRFFTIGLSAIFMNAVVLYIFEYLVNKYTDVIGYSVSLGGLGNTILLSFVLSVVLTIVHRIIRRMI